MSRDKPATGVRLILREVASCRCTGDRRLISDRGRSLVANALTAGVVVGSHANLQRRLQNQVPLWVDRACHFTALWRGHIAYGCAPGQKT